MSYYILFSCFVLHVLDFILLLKFISCRLRIKGKLPHCTKHNCVHCATCPASCVNELNLASELLEKAEKDNV